MLGSGVELQLILLALLIPMMLPTILRVTEPSAWRTVSNMCSCDQAGLTSS
jgi:hypothetical protein